MEKNFRKHRFHSTLLIPFEVADEALALDEIDCLERITLWTEAHQSSHYFKAGDAVVHKDNLSQKMIVDRILKKEIPREDAAGGLNGKITKIIGIDCHWWEVNTEKYE